MTDHSNDNHSKPLPSPDTDRGLRPREIAVLLVMSAVAWWVFIAIVDQVWKIVGGE